LIVLHNFQSLGEDELPDMQVTLHPHRFAARQDCWYICGLCSHWLQSPQIYQQLSPEAATKNLHRINYSEPLAAGWIRE
jgi:hypothetical protein